jgi:shikimate dehydrogenase
MAKPLVLGIIGYPVGHTLSPLMHGLAATEGGIDLSYAAFEIRPEKLGEAIAALRTLGATGFNVTVPHKVAVMEYLDEVVKDAAAIGAVNTVVNDNGRLVGYNTDAAGFVDSVRKDAGVDPAGKRVFVYGAGGAARAVAIGLAKAGAARIDIANRTYAKAEALAARVAENSEAVVGAVAHEAENLLETVGAADIIVNTTSVGMEGGGEGTTPPGVAAIRSGALAVDIVYRPLWTPFLQAAVERGADTLDGLWMLIRQGDRAFRLWTGGAAFPIEPIRRALLDTIGRG